MSQSCIERWRAPGRTLHVLHEAEEEHANRQTDGVFLAGRSLRRGVMDEHGRWTVRLLEASIQSSGLSEREIEERLGWETGLLGRVLDGTAECGPLQLLEILAELSTERRGSSSRFRHRERGTQMVEELIERFRDLGYGQPGAASAAAVLPPAPDDIEKTVEEVLQQTFGKNLGKGGRGG